MQEILLKIRNFERWLSKSLKKFNFIFLLNSVPFNGQSHQQQKRSKTIDQSLFRLRNKFSKTNVSLNLNKCEFLATQVKDKIDVLMILETEIDESSPKENFLIEGFCTPYRLDRDSKGGVIML